MYRFFADYEELFLEAFKSLHTTLDALPEEALDWSPGEGMNSTAVLITHVAGSARYWVGDMAKGDSSDRVRQTEFEAGGVTTAVLKQRLDDCQAYIQGALATFELADLEKERSAPGRDRTFSVGWCLLHALEHTTEHVGHLQMLGQLWEAQ